MSPLPAPLSSATISPQIPPQDGGYLGGVKLVPSIGTPNADALSALVEYVLDVCIELAVPPQPSPNTLPLVEVFGEGERSSCD
jgi:hypothetical protein